MRSLIIAISGAAAFALLFLGYLTGNPHPYIGALACVIIAVIATATDSQKRRKEQ